VGLRRGYGCLAIGVHKDLKLHANATTTSKVRGYIQRSAASVAELAAELGVSQTTVRLARPVTLSRAGILVMAFCDIAMLALRFVRVTARGRQR